jgi:hypothetical protein
MLAQSVAVYRVSIFRISLPRRLLMVLLAFLPLVPYALTGQIDPSHAGTAVTLVAGIAATLVLLSGPEVMRGPILRLYARLPQSEFKQRTLVDLAFFGASAATRFSPDRFQLACLAPQILTVLLGLTGALPAASSVLIALVYAATLTFCGAVIDTMLEARLTGSL